MATIVRRRSKNGQIRYRAEVRRKGTPLRSATFATLSDARKWVQVTEAAILEGRHFPQAVAQRHTLAELVDRYVVDVLPQKRPSTIPDQRRQLLWWKAQLGPLALAEVTPPIIVAYRDKLAKGRANATVVRYLAVLSHAFTIAVKEWQWCEINPVRSVRRPKEPRGRVRFLTDEERQRLLQACRGSRNPYLYTIVVLALATGARRGELLGLGWPDVDLTRGTLTFQETKNGERRAVPLTGQALVLMQQRWETRRHGTALVFPDATRRRPLSIRDAFEAAVERAGITDFRFHDLRHSAASYLAMNGASLMEIADVLGHKTLAMVKRYAHLSDQHTRGVVERMNAAIFGA